MKWDRVWLAAGKYLNPEPILILEVLWALLDTLYLDDIRELAVRSSNIFKIYVGHFLSQRMSIFI